ncbi:mpv17-like protein 2 [Littorina saxatilis]|uniref:Mpv17-like protein 2 n=1 Tax=Littorina saxatilis TaxID=31220 RepID=A0AAN9B7D7_9CAEN
MNGFKSAVQSLFTRHLFLTNVISCGGLLCVGDGIIQNLERFHMKRLTGISKEYNYERTGRMLVIGLVLGPFNHHWYRLLDKLVVGSGLKVVVKKIAADQAVAGPFFCSCFLIGMGLMEGKSPKECGKEWSDKFLTIYMADWCVWPPAQFINFYFLPTRFRVLYVSMVTLCWNTFLSFMKHKDSHHHDVLEAQQASKPDTKSHDDSL